MRRRSRRARRRCCRPARAARDRDHCQPGDQDVEVPAIHDHPRHQPPFDRWGAAAHHQGRDHAIAAGRGEVGLQQHNVWHRRRALGSGLANRSNCFIALPRRIALAHRLGERAVLRDELVVDGELLLDLGPTVRSRATKAAAMAVSAISDRLRPAARALSHRSALIVTLTVFLRARES